jgi:hypothetical protein
MVNILNIKLFRLKAFTLLEQSIVILILSIISTSLLLYYNNITHIYKYNDDRVKLKTIEKSLMAYYLNNVLKKEDLFPLPYPAKADLDLFDNNFARSVDDLLDILQYNSTDYYYGVIPTRDLGLSDDYMFDSWGNRISFIRKKEIKNYSDNLELNLQPIYFLFSHGSHAFNAYNRYGIKNNNFASNKIKLTNLLDDFAIAADAIIIKKNYINFITEISGGKLLSKIFCDYLKIEISHNDYCAILKMRLLALCVV